MALLETKDTAGRRLFPERTIRRAIWRPGDSARAAEPLRYKDGAPGRRPPDTTRRQAATFQDSSTGFSKDGITRRFRLGTKISSAHLNATAGYPRKPRASTGTRFGSDAASRGSPASHVRARCAPVRPPVERSQADSGGLAGQTVAPGGSTPHPQCGCGIPSYGAAPESNRPSVGLPHRTGFEALRRRRRQRRRMLGLHASKGWRATLLATPARGGGGSVLRGVLDLRAAEQRRWVLSDERLSGDTICLAVRTSTSSPRRALSA